MIGQYNILKDFMMINNFYSVNMHQNLLKCIHFIKIAYPKNNDFCTYYFKNKKGK